MSTCNNMPSLRKTIHRFLFYKYKIIGLSIDRWPLTRPGLYYYVVSRSFPIERSYTFPVSMLSEILPWRPQLFLTVATIGGEKLQHSVCVHPILPIS